MHRNVNGGGKFGFSTYICNIQKQKTNLKAAIMKRILLLPCVACASLTSYAQDKIITTDGDVIVAYNVDMGSSSIYYKSTEDDVAKWCYSSLTSLFLWFHSVRVKQCAPSE